MLFKKMAFGKWHIIVEVELPTQQGVAQKNLLMMKYIDRYLRVTVGIVACHLSCVNDRLTSANEVLIQSPKIQFEESSLRERYHCCH